MQCVRYAENIAGILVVRIFRARASVVLSGAGSASAGDLRAGARDGGALCIGERAASADVRARARGCAKGARGVKAPAYQTAGLDGGACRAAKVSVAALRYVLWLLAAAFALAFSWAPAAWAYVDPSIMTYTIQAVAGAAVALSTVFGVFARRSRKKLMALLDIDENARRKVEPRWHVRGEAAAASANDAGNAGECADGAAAAATAGDAGEGEAVAASANVDGGGVAGAAAKTGTAAGGANGFGAAGEVAASGAVVSASVASDDAPEKSHRPKRKKRARRAYRPDWCTRIVYALLSCGFTICTIFVVAPYEIIGGSAGSLVFSLADVWWVAALPAVAAIAVSALLLSALRGRVFNFFLVLISAIGLAAYVQVLVLNQGMPLADGGTIVWAEHTDMMIVSGVVWVAIIVLSLVLSFFNRRRAQGVVGLLCACLLVVQGVGVASLFLAPPSAGSAASSVASATGANGSSAASASASASASATAAADADAASAGATGGDGLTHTNLVSQTETALTEDGLYTVSSKNNVIVFVLDTYDQTLLNTVLRQNPDLLSEMTGFTEFQNCTGAMIPTRFAVPYLLTGELPRVGEDSATYLAERYERGMFLQDAKDAGYSIGLYTDSLQIGTLPQAEQDAIAATTVNMHKVSSSALDFGGTLSAMVQMALYRDAPWVLKSEFWYYTDQINGRIVAYNPDADPGERVYTMNDPRYFGQLRKQGLSIDDSQGQAGSFRFIHLLGAHYPYSLDENGNDLGADNSTKEQQAQGSMRIVSEYLRQLKELGVYDQSTIIITADHGRWFLTPEPLTTTSTPIMLVKPATSGAAAGLGAGAGADDEAMQGTAADTANTGAAAANVAGADANGAAGTATAGAAVEKSTMPVSQHDYLPTVAQAMGLNAADYGSGLTFFQVNDPTRVRTYITTDSIGLRGIGFREYEIDGNALSFANWHETGNYWSLEE